MPEGWEDSLRPLQFCCSAMMAVDAVFDFLNFN